MGGFVFLLTDIHNSGQMRRQILECYSLSEDSSEYQEEICKENSGKIWFEELYLRGSDDEFIIIFAGEEKSSVLPYFDEKQGQSIY